MAESKPSRTILPVSRLLDPVDPAEVARVAGRLGTRFPEGYEPFITTYGAGCLSTWVEIYPPAEVERSTDWHRQFVREQIANGQWFWDRDGVLKPERVAEAVVIGGTQDGDTIVFHPGDPDVLYALPRHKGVISRIGRGLDEAFDWLFLSGELCSPIAIRAFEPMAERDRQDWSIDLDFDEVRAALLGLGIHDAIIHDERDEDTGDRILELFIEEFAGTITATVAGGEDEPCDVTIVRDPGPSTPKLDRLMALLDAM